jgi:flagellar M-ring protein FliF
LVRGAIGFNAERGDSIEVINMRFADMDMPEAEETGLFLGLEKEDLFRIGQYLVVVVLGVLILFLVVRPLVKNAAEAIPVAAAGINNPLLAGNLSRPALAPPQPDGADGQARYLPAETGSRSDEIDVNQVDGRVNMSAMKRVGEIVEKHPDEALTIVRGWLNAEQ